MDPKHSDIPASTRSSVAVSEDAAIRVAEEFVTQKSIEAGQCMTIRHSDATELLGHGIYFVYFEYAGPPVEDETKADRLVCHSPGVGQPIVIQVNDQTAEASLFLRL